jgi:hypothetical protein
VSAQCNIPDGRGRITHTELLILPRREVIEVVDNYDTQGKTQLLDSLILDCLFLFISGYTYMRINVGNFEKSSFSRNGGFSKFLGRINIFT